MAGTEKKRERPGWVLRKVWVWALLIVALCICASVFWTQLTVRNDFHARLDKLASVPLSERWSHPDYLRIRALGPKAVPPLRHVLIEQDRITTRILLWAKRRWPSLGKRFSFFPDEQKLSARRWTACQVIQTLGPAAKSAAPEIIHILCNKDIGEVNGGAMALYAIGLDANICEQLNTAMEKGVVSEPGRGQIVHALGSVKPASTRTVKVLTKALTDPSKYVQRGAISSLNQLGAAGPEVVSNLKQLASTNNDTLLAVTACDALWSIEKNTSSVLPALFEMLGKELIIAPARAVGTEDSGQGVDGTDQIFMAAGHLFRRMNLPPVDRARALSLLDGWCEKTDRIFVRMLLLSDMAELGYAQEKCVDLCLSGLKRQEIYYRLQAAQLLWMLSAQFGWEVPGLGELLHNDEVGVRVYAAGIHWRKYKNASIAVPVLAETLNRKQYQSYYYDQQILPATLGILSEIGPEAHEATAALENISHDANPAVAKKAQEILTGLGPSSASQK